MQNSFLLECPGCLISRDILLEMPCCLRSFCKNCLENTAFCPKCSKVFDVKRCRPVYPLPAIISAVIAICPFPGCDRKIDPLLLQQHKESCRFKPTTDIETLDPHYSSPQDQEQKKLRNMYCNYLNMYHKQVSQDPRFFNHIILPSDTLQGIALRYGVTTRELRDENMLTTTAHLHERAALKIPIKRNNAPSQDIDPRELKAIMERRLVARFMKETRTKERSEALFYLEETNFDVNAATQLFFDDGVWAHEHPCPKSLTQPSSAPASYGVVDAHNSINSQDPSGAKKKKHSRKCLALA